MLRRPINKDVDEKRVGRMMKVDVRKSQAAQKAGEQASSSLRGFIGDVKSEIRRVTWTSPEELKSYTKIIVFATFLFGLGIYSVDLMIQRVLDGIGVLLQVLIG